MKCAIIHLSDLHLSADIEIETNQNITNLINRVKDSSLSRIRSDHL